MDKQVLSEINRSREIMGLGQLLREQTAEFVTSKQIEQWFRGDGSEKMKSVVYLIAKISAHGFEDQKINGGTVWEALSTAFKNVTGKAIVKCDDMEVDECQGTKIAFAKGQWNNKMVQQFAQKQHYWRHYHIKTTTEDITSKYAIVYNQEEGKLPTAVVSSGELKGYVKKEVSLSQLVYDINTFNVNHAGEEQITMAGKHKMYIRRGGSNLLKSQKITDALYLWSYTKTMMKHESTPDETIPGKKIAGEVLNRHFGDSYENLQIVISDDTEVQELKQKMAQHTKNGGTIDSITITSTASNTGLKDDAKADFATKMNKAGFSEYANVSNIKGNEGDFTIDEVDTTDEALAVVRGKLLAKLLGVEDKAVFKFSITSGAKVVNVSVQGTSPATQEPDIVKKGSAKTTETKTELSGDGKVVLPVMKVDLVKGSLGTKISRAFGMDKGSKRRRDT